MSCYFLPCISLHNGASYETVDGRKVLYLDGNGAYAETPAIPIQTTSFSILCWVKFVSIPGYPVNIYSDWSAPHQFRLGILNHKLIANLRRPGNTDKGIVYFYGGYVLIFFKTFTVEFRRGDSHMKGLGMLVDFLIV